MNESRFRDKGEHLSDFLGYVLVECPRCKKCAKTIVHPSKTEPRLVCEMCGLLKNLSSVLYGNFAGFGGLKLWLTTNCCGDTLWAYNKEHMDFLGSYVSALVRERVPNINQSVASRLPVWIMSTKNRDTVLNCIEKLRQQL